MNPAYLRRRLRANESALCLRANALCARYALLRFFAVVSRLGDGVFWYALIAALAVFGGATGRAAALHLGLIGSTSLILYKALKAWTRRPRPCAADLRIRAWVAPLDEFSFPSGHTLHAVGFTIVALAYFPSLAWLLIPFAASVAVSRVVLGLHYPSDVAAATVIGSGLASASFWLRDMLPSMI
ncbi:MAG: phosphatase PAP2 family protein [Lysobacteraceae bacterium]|nr:MAG: phosphatase PAP2 family protein [Xanthomonadaceae bacterium]